MTTMPRDRSRRSPQLDAVLLADAARERARAARDLLIGLLALLGLPLWLLTAWPGRFSSEARALAAAGWAVVALGVLASLARERWWTRRRSRHIQAMGPLPALRRERPGAAACASAADEQD